MKKKREVKGTSQKHKQCGGELSYGKLLETQIKKKKDEIQKN